MTVESAIEPIVDTRGQTDSIVKRVLTRPGALIPLVVLIVILLSGIFAGVLSPFDPNKTDLLNFLAGPSGDHWLGTNSSGQDVLSRLLFGARNTLTAAGLAVVISMALGVVSGLVAGYFGGWFDAVSNWVISLIMSMPGIMVLLAASAVLGKSVYMAMAVFGVLMAPGFHRLVAGMVREVRDELYVDAARVTGLSDTRIIGRHILSVVRAPIVIQSGIVFSIAVKIQAGLEIIGLGDLNTPTWGGSLRDGFQKLFTQPLLVLWPSLILAATTLSLTLFANAIRDEFERSGPRVGRKDRKRPPEANAPIPEADPVHHPQAETDLPALLEVDGLTIGYPDGYGRYALVVRDVSLTVHRGQILGLIGESGSGKTQTAFGVMGLLPSTGRVVAGSVTFDGEPLVVNGDDLGNQSKVLGTRIGYIPQEPMSNLDPAFTVGQQLVEPMTVVLGINKGEARKRALDLLERVEIPDPVRTFNSYPHQLSGGMAQRVLIAGALSCGADLIIADEPTTALDVTVEAEVLDLLRELQQETNVGLLLVTHNFGVVADLCDQVAVMQYGMIIESGPVRSIFHEAEHPYTQSLLDAILDGSEGRGAYRAPVLEVTR
jgi:ABC-type dipeptide/oligopeptide/nickel transport system ATPase component/ABC-type dipeptide/oligopeptide/nickel transport system permease subunit